MLLIKEHVNWEITGERSRWISPLNVSYWEIAKYTFKSFDVHTARFLKYVWPFFNIAHEKVCVGSEDSMKIIISWISFFYENSFKGTLSGPTQFLTTKSPLKIMENGFYFTLKAHFVLKILKLCLHFLVT